MGGFDETCTRSVKIIRPIFLERKRFFFCLAAFWEIDGRLRQSNSKTALQPTGTGMAEFSREPGILNFWSPRVHMKKLRIWKNVIILSFGFVLLFTAFQSISNLQSTMNSDEGLGTTSLAMVYGRSLVRKMIA